MGAIPGLLLSWKGAEYRCRTTMDVIMRIEDKVTLSELAQRAMSGSEKGVIPRSHFAWVMFCLLNSGGASVTPEQVWESIKTGESTIEELLVVIQFVIAEVYGTGPEDSDDLDMDEGVKK